MAETPNTHSPAAAGRNPAAGGSRASRSSWATVATQYVTVDGERPVYRRGSRPCGGSLSDSARDGGASLPVEYHRLKTESDSHVLIVNQCAEEHRG